MAGVMAICGACEATNPPPSPSAAVGSVAPVPTQPPATPSPAVEPTPTTTAPTAVTPSPGPVASVLPTLVPTLGPGATTWQYLADFPAGPAIEVAGVASTGSGFIAVGSEPAEGQDFFGLRQGVVWTSADGIAWRRSTPEAFANSTLLHVVGTADTAYVLGVRSICELAAEECDDLPDAGMTVWRNDGRGWQRLSQPAVMREAFLAGVVMLDETLVAYGDRPSGGAGGELEATVWASADGAVWDASTELAGMDPISAVAVGPDGLIAFGTRFLPGSDTIETVAAASPDGLNFEPLALPEGLDIVVESVAFGEQGFVAAGAADDATPSGARPSVLVSATGQAWAEVDLGDSLAGAVLQQIRATPAGYVLVGARPSEADRQRDDAFSWVSEDGREWLREAPLGGGAYRLFNGLASGPGGAVAVALDYEDDPGDGPLSTIRVWFAAQPLLVPR